MNATPSVFIITILSDERYDKGVYNTDERYAMWLFDHVYLYGPDEKRVENECLLFTIKTQFSERIDNPKLALSSI